MYRLRRSRISIADFEERQTPSYSDATGSSAAAQQSITWPGDFGSSDER
jgi:hypothetical protein